MSERQELPISVQQGVLDLLAAMTSVDAEHCHEYANRLDIQAVQLLDLAPADGPLDGTRWVAILNARTAELLRAVAVARAAGAV
jgi:hypothetical protein